MKKLLLFFQKKQENKNPLLAIQESLDLKVLKGLKPWRLPSWQQLKFLPKLLDKRQKRSLIISICIFVVAFATLITRFWSSATFIVPKVGGSYAEGLIGSPRFINPLLAQGNDVDRDLTSLIFAGLVKNDGNGALIPNLAQSIDINDDQKVYTIQLKENLFWQDGEPLTIDDVLYTIKTIQDPAFKSPLYVSFAGVEMKQIDKNTISFILKEPFPAFLSALTTGIIPQHIWYSIPVSQAHLAEANIKPIGAGPYAFKSLTKDTNGGIRSITLTRYENYTNDKPFIKELVFKFYPDYPTAVEALKNKNVEGLGFIPLEFKKEIENNRAVNLKQLDLSQYNALFFNPDKNEILKDKNIRKALAYAIDRDRIIRDALDGNGERINGPASVSTDATSTLSFDPSAAAKLLDDAGWKVTASSTIRMKDKKELQIALTVADQKDNTQTAAIIQENWQAIGIKTDLTTVPKNKIKKETIEPRNYQILLFGQVVSSDQDLYAFWHSSQYRHPGNNLSLLGNKDINAILETVRTTHDTTEQQTLHEKLNNKLTEEMFGVFLYTPNYLYPLAQKIHGTETLFRISTPADRFAAISQWFIETRRRFK